MFFVNEMIRCLQSFNHVCCKEYRHIKCSITALSSACVHWKKYSQYIFFYLMYESMLTKLIFSPLCRICFFKNQTGDPEKNKEWLLKNLKRLIGHSREEWSPCAIYVCIVWQSWIFTNVMLLSENKIHFWFLNHPLT